MKLLSLDGTRHLAEVLPATTPRPHRPGTVRRLLALVDQTAARLGVTRQLLLRAAARQFCAYGTAVQSEVLANHLTAQQE